MRAILTRDMAYVKLQNPPSLLDEFALLNLEPKNYQKPMGVEVPNFLTHLCWNTPGPPLHQCWWFGEASARLQRENLQLRLANTRSALLRATSNPWVWAWNGIEAAVIWHPPPYPPWLFLHPSAIGQLRQPLPPFSSLAPGERALVLEYPGLSLLLVNPNMTQKSWYLYI